MSRIRSSSATSVAALTVASASALKALAQTTSSGIGTSAPRAFMASITAWLHHQVGLGQALADLQAGGQHEGVGDAAADDQAVDVLRQALQDGQLGADLGAGDDGHQRALRVGQGLADGVHLGRQQRAGAGDGGGLGDAVGGAFGAVRGAEGVVHEDVAQGASLAASSGLFFFSPLFRRQFSSSTTSPGATENSPSTQLATSGTSRPSSWPRRAATGASESSGLNSPSVGRPRWLVTMTAAPASSAIWMAGMARGCGCLR
jgi:hypothetical protein